jgi:hypothetical protein
MLMIPGLFNPGVSQSALHKAFYYWWKTLRSSDITYPSQRLETFKSISRQSTEVRLYHNGYVIAQ